MSFSSSGSSPHQIWEATLAQLLLRVTRQNYDTWLRSTVGLRFDETTLVVAAPNDLTCDWLSTRMRTVIGQALSAVAGPGLSVRFESAEEAIAAINPPALQPPLLPRLSTPLNPRFTFSTFLQGSFNQLALSAAQDISAGDGNSIYSPLLITGSSGSGKTHLLHAIGHEAAAQSIRFVLAGAEQFLSEFTTAVRNRSGAAFRSHYRDLDLLLIDDVHVLHGKKATLNEFYQTISGLSDQGRMVVVTGEPSAMNGEAARFKTQLRWGLVTNLDQPSVEDRIRFVKAKAEYQGINLPGEVQHYLAIRIKGSIRDLEGAINRVTALARISQEPVSIDFTARALQPLTQPLGDEPQRILPAELVGAVCQHLGIELSDLASPRRNRSLTYARHIAMYLLRSETGLTYSAIAHMLGKKDHSTVVHACSQLEREAGTSPNLRADLDAIKAVIHGSGTAA